MNKRVIRGFGETASARNCMDKESLDDRFKSCDAGGMYLPCQPLYGFSKNPHRRGSIQWYIITYGIMKLLSELDFGSLLEVGAAEGFTSYLVKEKFGSDTVSCDLSEEACKRGKEIFGNRSACIDASHLPFRNGAFDVVLCSETLEHLPDLPSAVSELLRVARKSVVITVPHESRRLIEKNRSGSGLGSSHVHSFDDKSFNFLPFSVISGRMLSPLLKPFHLLIESPVKEHLPGSKYPEPVLRAYNSCIPALRRVFGRGFADLLIIIDHFLCRITGLHECISFVILKDTCSRQRAKKRISPSWIMNFAMPLHYKKK